MKMEDSLWAGLTDSHAGLPMGMTAENLAEKVRYDQPAILIERGALNSLVGAQPRKPT